MTKITMPLKELSEAFQQSAADETLSIAERRLAAQMSVLAAHVQRIEGTAARSLNVLGGPEGRMTKVEKLLAEAMKVAPESKPTTPATPAAAPVAPTPVKGEIVNEGEEDEEDEEDGGVAKFLAEAAAEERAARATAGAPPPKPALVSIDNKESA